MKTGVMALGLLVMNSAATAEQKPVEVPTITEDKCSMHYDENRVMECTTTYSNGEQDTYYVKNGKIYFHYPIDNRVPSGGDYKPHN